MGDMGVLEITAIAGLIASAAGGGYSAYSSYQQGKAQETANRAAAEEAMRQAELENERAGIAQLAGEQEAEKRSRQLAAAIGAEYATWAGNGLMVDGRGKDTLGSVLSTTVAEAEADISTIRDNAAMEVWGHQSNAAALRASAANSLIAGRNASAAGTTGAVAGGISTGGSLLSGYANSASRFGKSGEKHLLWNPTGSKSKVYD